MKIGFPTPKFNAKVADGTVGPALKAILEEQKPEAAYFIDTNGGRGAVLVVEVSDPSKIPAFAEPWFLTFDATMEFHIAMSPADLGAAGLDELGRKWCGKG